MKTIIFDFDDTLQESESFFEGALGNTSKYLSKKYELDYDLVYKKSMQIYRKKGPNYKLLFNDCLSYFKIYSDKEVKKLVSIFYSYNNEEINKENYNVIRILNKKNRIIILTKGKKIKQEKRIKSFLKDIKIENIYYADDMGYSKPSIELLEEVIKKSKIKKENCFVIGDSPISDIAPASYLSIKCIRIKNGFYKKYKSKFNERTIEKLPELLKIFK